MSAVLLFLQLASFLAIHARVYVSFRALPAIELVETPPVQCGSKISHTGILKVLANYLCNKEIPLLFFSVTN